jgi:LPS export ABC transporter protein LptC
MKYRITLLVRVIIVTLILISCENKNTSIPKEALLSLPSLTAKHFETEFIDSGRLQMIMSAPIMEKFDLKENPYSEFTSGIHVNFYKGKKEIQGSVTAKYAKYTEKDNMWELKDSVVVINEANEKLETELLYWDQKADVIQTDRFVKMTDADQIMTGVGFRTDSRLKVKKFKKVRAIINLP